MDEAIDYFMNSLMFSFMSFQVKQQIANMHQSAYAGDLHPFKHLAEFFKDEEDYLMTFLGGKNLDGTTYLHSAAAGGRNDVCKFLLEKGKVDIDYKDFVAGQTPLHYAIKERRLSTVVCLLENGADPNATTKKRRISLHYAVENGSKELIQLLISKGAEINAVAADCGTPLQMAAGMGRDVAVKFLLDLHADPNVTSPDLFSPLLAAIRAESLECIELLLKAGADLNFCGYKGTTPLGYAASEGLKGIVRCLLRAGADPKSTNYLGLTPLEEAVLKGKRRVFEVLFHLTSPIPTIPKWNVSGLFRHVNSDKAREEREQKVEELFPLSKPKGAECFHRKDYVAAIQWYTQALSFKPNDAVVLSERSLCWARMNEGALALEDADACIILKPKWSQAHCRAGAAKMLINGGHAIDEAVDAFVCALTLDPQDKAVHRALRDAHEAQIFRKSFFM